MRELVHSAHGFHLPGSITTNNTHAHTQNLEQLSLLILSIQHFTLLRSKYHHNINMAFGVLDALLFCLQLYFILMNVTVERYYCNSPFEENDTRFLIKETIEFCTENNPLFLARPYWMVCATCISAYAFCFGYILVLVALLTNSWKKMAVPLLLFIGAKLNAIFFYHFMEFTSSTPPMNLIPYFSVEGPYIVSIMIVIYKVSASLISHSKRD